MPPALVGNQASQRERMIAFNIDTREVLKLVNDGLQVEQGLLIALIKGVKVSPVISKVIATPLDGVNIAVQLHLD